MLLIDSTTQAVRSGGYKIRDRRGTGARVDRRNDPYSPGTDYPPLSPARRVERGKTTPLGPRERGLLFCAGAGGNERFRMRHMAKESNNSHGKGVPAAPCAGGFADRQYTGSGMRVPRALEPGGWVSRDTNTHPPIHTGASLAFPGLFLSRGQFISLALPPSPSQANSSSSLPASARGPTGAGTPVSLQAPCRPASPAPEGRGRGRGALLLRNRVWRRWTL